MLLCIFFLFGTSAGVLGNDDICERSRHQSCPIPHDWSFPKTEEDLNQICPRFIRIAECKRDYLKECEPEAVPWQRYLQNLKDVAEEACEKNSELHLRIVQNIGCFNEVAQQDTEICYNDIDKKTEVMLKYIRESETEEASNELWVAYRCLLSSFEIQCYASKSSERCGNDAGNLVLELSRRTGFRYLCSVASEESLSKLLTLLELELEEKASLDRIMSRA